MKAQCTMLLTFVLSSALLVICNIKYKETLTSLHNV